MQVIDLYDFSGETYALKYRSFDLRGAPAGAMICEVAPGSASRIHNHAEAEAFLVLQGHGTVTDGVQRQSISVGQGVLFSGFVNHVIENNDPNESLRLISIYWMEDLARDNVPRKSVTRSTIIFSTPPTPNGDLHLGHLSGPYLAADILRRSLSQRGVHAQHITGRDDHQTYVMLRARRDGREPGVVADTNASAIRATLAATGVVLDGFIEPNRDGLYADFVADFVRRLLEAGLVEARLTPVLIDAEGEVLHEAYVRGTCPHCGSGADGNACEACGRPIGCTALLDPVHAISGLPVQRGEALRLHLLLRKLASRLDHIVKELRLPTHVYACAQTILDEQIEDIPISQSTSWGLPVRVPGFTDQKLYVWFEMAAGYLFGAAHAVDPEARDLAALWGAACRAFSDESEIVHCYGFDNAWYHSLLFPAVYAALGLTVPRVHIVNELLELEGTKFSTSRNHLIWAQELLSEVPVDALRYGLCKVRPQEVRTSFELDIFLRDVNALFCEAMPDWIRRLKALAAPHGGCVPEPGAWLPDHQVYLARIRVFSEAAEDMLLPERFDPRGWSEALALFVDDSRRFCAVQGALGMSNVQKDYARTAAALGLMGLSAFGILAEPIVPTLAREVQAALGASSDPGTVLRFLPVGRTFELDRIAPPPQEILAPRTAAGLAARIGASRA